MKKAGMIGAAVLAGAIVAGCSKDEQPAAEAPASSGDPNEVLVSVNGATLTRGALDADVAKIEKAQEGKYPAEQRDYIRQMTRNQLAQAFMMECVLVKAAKDIE